MEMICELNFIDVRENVEKQYEIEPKGESVEVLRKYKERDNDELRRRRTGL